MLRIIRSIAFVASRHIELATECQISLFPIVFTLRNTGVHVYTTDSSNIITNIELSVDNTLSFGTVL